MSEAAAASAHHSDDEEVTPGYVAPAKVRNMKPDSSKSSTN